MNKTLLCYLSGVFFLAYSPGGLQGLSEHNPPLSTIDNCPVVKYRLVDLGPTGLEQKDLTKLEQVYSLAPTINNLGQIVYNTLEGAYVRDPAFGEYALKLNGAKVYAHATNNKGQILVSVNRETQGTEWMLWPRRSNFGCAWEEKDLNAKKRHIANLEGSNTSLFMCTLNDESISTGFYKQNQTLTPLVWTLQTGLKPMGYCSGLNVMGFPRALNNNGTVAGYYQAENDSPPFVWHPCKGIHVLRNFRSLVQCQGWIDLADLALTQNNIVYGTYIVRHTSQLKGNTDDVGTYFLYRWNPSRDDFLVLNIRDFRITAVNGANTLVGTHNGKAAMRRQGDFPLELSKVVPDDLDGWELLEATAINDKDQVVGYGKKVGQLHNFLIEPLP